MKELRDSHNPRNARRGKNSECGAPGADQRSTIQLIKVSCDGDFESYLRIHHACVALRSAEYNIGRSLPRNARICVPSATFAPYALWISCGKSVVVGKKIVPAVDFFPTYAENPTSLHQILASSPTNAGTQRP